MLFKRNYLLNLLFSGHTIGYLMSCYFIQNQNKEFSRNVVKQVSSEQFSYLTDEFNMFYEITHAQK
jgi:tryptophanase